MDRNRIFNNKYFLSLDLSLISILLLFILFGIILIPYYQFQINPDGIVYLNIAKIYFSGNVYSAIDPYHSPLISWLLVPFFIFGSNPVYLLFSTKILSLIIGFFTIIGIRQLSYNFEMNNNIRNAILFAFIPILLYFTYSVITPDLLMVCLLVYYLNIIYSSKYAEKLSYGLICGFIGTIAYFAKSYAFPFFIVHFALFNFLHYFKNIEYRRKVLKNLILGFLVFFVVSGVWIGAISHKEGKITYSTAAEFNHNLVGPDSSKVWTTQYLGDSPVYIQPWSAFDSWYTFKYQLNLIFKNTIQTIDIFTLFSYFSILILLIYLLIFIKPIKKILKDDRIYPFLTIIIFSAGYTIVLLEERYLWLVYILLFLMGGYLTNLFFKNKLFTNTRKILVLLILIVSFVFMPISSLSANINADKDVYILANEIEMQHDIYGNIAANTNDNKMIYLAYYLNANYSGQTKPETTQTDLIKYNIDFYFVWNNKNNIYSQYKEIAIENREALKIYSIKHF
ncbi:hypothetical protein [Methanobacterium sp. ACI-7]|uniref:hypothetical protein n=1 Tax=unclassified Methanobacterium TaxID=2627676 RepID=UPI0039C19B7B